MLRAAGIAVGLSGLLLLWLLRRRCRPLRNLDWLLGSALACGLVFVASFPDALNGILATFSFEKGHGGRLIGLLIFSQLLLYLFFSSQVLRTNRLADLVERLVSELAKKDYRSQQPTQTQPISIIIPAYNEAENIPVVLDQIPAEVLGLATQLLVVVDGATDTTEDVVRQQNHAPVSCVVNRGSGSALKAGYELAIEQGARIVVTLDADGQHQPGEIVNLVKPILDEEADLVCGSRVLGEHQKDSRIRSFGIVFFNLLVSLLVMRRITDCSNSFRAIRADELAKLDLRQPQFHASELLIEACRKGLRIIEVPVTVKKRLSGASKKPPSLRYGWGFTKAIFLTWLR